MPNLIETNSRARIFRRSRLSLPFIAPLLAFGFATAISFALLGAGAQERPHPKQSTSDVAVASDPSLWDKMAPFQSVYAQPSPDTTCCNPYYGCYMCHPEQCPGGCDDGNPCTKDFCDTKTNTCVNEPTSGGKCDDGNACTTNDTCSNGTCIGTPITGTSCPTGNVCSSGTCSNGLCVGVPSSGNKCDDGNACTTNDTCSNGLCVGVPSSGNKCDDGNGCTTSDTCISGLCVGTPVNCDDGQVCTFDGCNSLSSSTFQCFHVPLSCDDGNICTVDSCDSATGCVHTPVPDGTSCDDSNVCTTNDTCSNGTCVGVPVPNGTICGDFNVCLNSLQCESGICTSIPGTICDDGDICTVDSCDTATGACTHSPLPGEAGPLMFMDPVTLQWGPALGASIYNTYRGTMPAGGLGSRSLVYDHVCFESGDAQLNGAQLSVDVEDPPVGTSFYYLVDGESSCGEGTLGTATSGTPEAPTTFCPTPP